MAGKKPPVARTWAPVLDTLADSCVCARVLHRCVCRQPGLAVQQAANGVRAREGARKKERPPDPLGETGAQARWTARNG